MFSESDYYLVSQPCNCSDRACLLRDFPLHLCFPMLQPSTHEHQPLTFTLSHIDTPPHAHPWHRRVMASRKITGQDVRESLNEVDAKVRHSAHNLTPASPNTTHNPETGRDSSPPTVARQIAILLDADARPERSESSLDIIGSQTRGQFDTSDGRLATSADDATASSMAGNRSATLHTGSQGVTRTKRLRDKDLWEDPDEEKEHVADQDTGRAEPNMKRHAPDTLDGAGLKCIKLESSPEQHWPGRRGWQDSSRSPTHARRGTAAHLEDAISYERTPDGARSPGRDDHRNQVTNQYRPSPGIARNFLSRVLPQYFLSEPKKTNKTQLLTENSTREASKPCFPKFNSLPDQVKDKIFLLLLRNPSPIFFNISKLSTFISRHATIPWWVERLPSKQSSTDYFLHVPNSTLQTQLHHLRRTIQALPPTSWAHYLATERETARLPSVSYSSNMTPSLLLAASKETQRRAARIFYSTNTFYFQNSKNAWLHLAAWLDTITLRNSQHVRHLHLAAPEWHAGPQHDAVQGAVLDAVSPATRLAASRSEEKPQTKSLYGDEGNDEGLHDRLLTSLATCVHHLAHPLSTLITLRLELPFPDKALRFVSRHADSERQLVRIGEAAAHVRREEEGLRLLKRLSERVEERGSVVPELIVKGLQRYGRGVEAEFKFRGDMERVAERYGWVVRFC